MIRLIISGEEGSPQHLSIRKDRVTIGREPDNDVVLPAPEVSRHHGEIHQRDGRFIIIDLNSTNGIFIGKRKVKRGMTKTVSIAICPCSLFRVLDFGSKW